MPVLIWLTAVFLNFSTMQSALGEARVPTGCFNEKASVHFVSVLRQESNDHQIPAEANGAAGLVASPTSGAVPFKVTFSVPGSGYWAIDFGDGSEETLIQGSVSHKYRIPGTYTARAYSDAPCLHRKPACMIAVRDLGTVTIVAQ